MNATAPAHTLTLSLHDALPISRSPAAARGGPPRGRPNPGRASAWAAATPAGADEARARAVARRAARLASDPDRKSTRLNSSHLGISYAVFCLKTKIVHTSQRER